MSRRLAVAAVVGLLLVAAPRPGLAEPPKSTDPAVVIELFAADPEIVTPVGLTVDARGRVLVVESHTHFRPADYKGPPADRIRLMEDRDGDGRAERVTTFFEGTKYTMGLGIHPADGAVLVATRYEVFKLRDADGDGRADGPPEPVATLKTAGDYPHNGLSGFAFDAQGRVYFGLGENLGASYSLVGRDGVTLKGGGEGGNVYRCEPDGSKLERVATGFWNPFHLAFDPFGRLFGVDNDPDSRPPCRLLHIVEGGDYGFKFRNGRKGLHPFTAWNGELPGTLPMVAGTGEAPSGLVIYGSDNLPSVYQGLALVTSWGDHRIDAFRLEPRGASFSATAKPLITGGEDFRPVGLAVAPDGSLYASDWVDKSYTLHGKGRVWHIRAKSPTPRVKPANDLDALAHRDRPTREAAARRLAVSDRPGLRKAVAAKANELAVAAALDALLTAATSADIQAIQNALGSPSSNIREQAVRSVPKQRLRRPAAAADDPAAGVAAAGFRRMRANEAVPALLKALESPDPFLTQAARFGLEHSMGVPRLVEIARESPPSGRIGALLALRNLDTLEARTAVSPALADADPAVQFAAVQWVGESKLTKHRPELLALLSKPAITQNLFEGTLAALERLDAGPRSNPRDELSGDEYVATWLGDPANKPAPAALRRALRSVRPDHPVMTEARLRGYLDSPDPGLKLEAVRTLRDGKIAGRFEALAAVARDATAPANLRAEAVVGLAASDLSDPKNRTLLVDLAAGPDRTLAHEAMRSLRGVTLTPAELDRLPKPAADPEASALRTLDATPTTAPSPTLDTWLGRLVGPANVEAGERLFFHPKGPGCYRCHQVEGRGGRTGPDLSATGSVLTRPRLIESIVNPSKEVAPQFVAWAVALNDGRVFTGTFLKETLDGRVYGDNQGKLITVKPSDIETAKALDVSIMPADLPRLMTDQEFRDLIAYLRSRGATPDATPGSPKGPR